jgi:hypothetical protein
MTLPSHPRNHWMVCNVHTEHNVAGLLMKPLPQPKNDVHMRYMGIRYLHE